MDDRHPPNRATPSGERPAATHPPGPPGAGHPTGFTPRPFRAPVWLRGAHAQTVGGKLFRRDPGVQLERQRLTLPDGDFVDIDLGPEPGREPDAPLALVLHGLEGSALRPYMRITYAELLRRGVRPIGLNFRSCSGQPNRADRLYHSGETTDLGHVVEHLGAAFPGRPIGAVGFSLGGNVLLKYLAERGAEAPLVAAAAVSVPYDLSAGARALEEGLMSRVYNGYFLRMLRGKMRAKEDALSGRIDLARALRARTLREFDESATAPLHGFEDAEDYYARSSSGPLLQDIRVPTLLLHSFDDPFLPAERVPVAAARGNPWIVAAFADTGGHVGFIEGTPARPRFWAEEEASRFLAAFLGASSPERSGERAASAPPSGAWRSSGRGSAGSPSPARPAASNRG